MRKSYAVILSLAMLTAPAFAQSPDAETTASAEATTESRPAARQFTKEMFEQRWKTEEATYREAGIPDEKIERLRELNSKIWEARSSGQRGDFQEIMKQRAEILTREEIEKVRDLRRKQLEKQLGHPLGAGNTTATRVISRNTTASQATGVTTGTQTDN